MSDKVYLGDSVYVEIEYGQLKLTTENGFGPTNTIYLEVEVYTALMAYMTAQITKHLSEPALDDPDAQAPTG